MPRRSTWRFFIRAPWPLLFGASGIGYALVTVGIGDDSTMAAICRGSGALDSAVVWFDPAGRTFDSAYGSLLAGWALMLLAMMPPLLASPLMHVWRSSMRRNRLSVVAEFVLGYWAAWTAAAPVLIGGAAALRVVAPATAFSLVLLVALVWSSSPWQRAAFNRGHRQRRISLFGLAAHRDAFAFGARHGAWCVATCWAWMMLPLVSGPYHVPVMVLVGVVMLAERLTMPRQSGWRLPVGTQWLANELPAMSAAERVRR